MAGEAGQVDRMELARFIAYADGEDPDRVTDDADFGAYVDMADQLLYRYVIRGRPGQ